MRTPVEIDEKIDKKISELIEKKDPRINIHGERSEPRWSTLTLDREIEKMRRKANGRLSQGIYPDIEFLSIREYLIEERSKRIPRKHMLWCQKKIAQALDSKEQNLIAIEKKEEKLQKKKKDTS